MSNVYFIQREPELAALRNHLQGIPAARQSEVKPERVGIESHYYWRGTGELEKAVSSFDLYQQTYPRDSSAHNTLGKPLRGGLETWKSQEKEFREALRLNPNAAAYYQNLGGESVVWSQ